jgi:transposase-like protein
MPGPRPPSVELTAEERRELEGLVRRHKTGQQLADRARIVLRAADGLNNSEIARELALEPDTVRLWRQRWLSVGGAAPADLPVAARLADAPRSGTPARITPEQVCRILALACEAPGGSGRPISRWSATELAAEIMRRGIVETISPRHAARLLKRGTSSRTGSGTG